MDPSCLSAYTASRLIPLDKSPGVHPIGVGEVCRRIVGKVIMKYAKTDLRQAVGPLQLCAGFESGCEAAMHAMSEIFEEEDTEAMIFVDASNAFNSSNREAILVNSLSVCLLLQLLSTLTGTAHPCLWVEKPSFLWKELLRGSPRFGNLRHRHPTID